MLHEAPRTPALLNESSKLWYEKVFAGQLTENDYLKSEARWIDVRDLANAHILAIEVEKAGGNRFICTAGEYVWQDWRAYSHILASHFLLMILMISMKRMSF